MSPTDRPEDGYEVSDTDEPDDPSDHEDPPREKEFGHQSSTELINDKEEHDLDMRRKRESLQSSAAGSPKGSIDPVIYNDRLGLRLPAHEGLPQKG